MADVEPILRKKEAMASQVDHDPADVRLEMRNVLSSETLDKLQSCQQQLSTMNGRKGALLASPKQ